MIMNKAILPFFLASGILFLVPGCDQDRMSGLGLVLPEGEAQAGKLAFIELRCYRCHSVAGSELPVTELETTIEYRLGGEISRVKTYGELVTSIVNPTHVVSERYIRSLGELAEAGVIESPMPAINERMTVSQLIDVVTFLNSSYESTSPTTPDRHMGSRPSNRYRVPVRCDAVKDPSIPLF